MKTSKLAPDCGTSLFGFQEMAETQRNTFWLQGTRRVYIIKPSFPMGDHDQPTGIAHQSTDEFL